MSDLGHERPWEACQHGGFTTSCIECHRDALQQSARAGAWLWTKLGRDRALFNEYREWDKAGGRVDGLAWREFVALADMPIVEVPE